MVRSVSNWPSLTHWWNWQSSSVTEPAAARVALFRESWLPIASGLAPGWARRSWSLSPNLHSGVPLRYARMTIWPLTSARRMVPVALMRRFTSSITSTNASFLRYFMSPLLHDCAPVACIVILEVSLGVVAADRIAEDRLSGVMYIFRTSTSVFWGYPKSSISARQSQSASKTQ